MTVILMGGTFCYFVGAGVTWCKRAFRGAWYIILLGLLNHWGRVPVGWGSSRCRSGDPGRGCRRAGRGRRPAGWRALGSPGREVRRSVAHTMRRYATERAPDVTYPWQQSHCCISGSEKSLEINKYEILGDLQWRIQDLAEVRGVNYPKPIIFFNSLHENERIWTPVGRPLCLPPLPPPPPPHP